MKTKVEVKVDCTAVLAALERAADAIEELADTVTYSDPIDLQLRGAAGPPPPPPPMPTLPENERFVGTQLTALDYFSLGVLAGLVIAGVAVAMMLP